MSILIKGMEMPNNCRDCPLEDAYEGYNCRIVEKSANWGMEGRPSWCPLIPVPPHGRLGDLDELHKEAVRRSEKAGTYDSWYNCMDRVISAFDIKNAPTIISADCTKEES